MIAANSLTPTARSCALEMGGGQLYLLLPIIDDGMKTNNSVSYCFTEVMNSSSFDTDNSVFLATPQFRPRVLSEFPHC